VALGESYAAGAEPERSAIDPLACDDDPRRDARTIEVGCFEGPVADAAGHDDDCVGMGREGIADHQPAPGGRDEDEDRGNAGDDEEEASHFDGGA
jgi:hypothetical protein